MPVVFFFAMETTVRI